MAQFNTDNENDIRRCRDALKDKLPITITAAVEDKVKVFKGVVQSIEENQNVSTKRWRVTIIE